MIAEKPSWIRHEGMQIFSIDVQPGGHRFATGGGDHKVWLLSYLILVCLVADKIQEMGNTMDFKFWVLRCWDNKIST